MIHACIRWGESFSPTHLLSFLWAQKAWFFSQQSSRVNHLQVSVTHWNASFTGSRLHVSPALPSSQINSKAVNNMKLRLFYWHTRSITSLKLAGFHSQLYLPNIDVDWTGCQQGPSSHHCCLTMVECSRDCPALVVATCSASCWANFGRSESW